MRMNVSYADYAQQSFVKFRQTETRQLNFIRNLILLNQNWEAHNIAARPTPTECTCIENKLHLYKFLRLYFDVHLSEVPITSQNVLLFIWPLLQHIVMYLPRYSIEKPVPYINFIIMSFLCIPTRMKSCTVKKKYQLHAYFL